MNEYTLLFDRTNPRLWLAQMYSLLRACSVCSVSCIGFDRAFAYGLKFPTAFGDTHLNQNRVTGNEEPIAGITRVRPN